MCMQGFIDSAHAFTTNSNAAAMTSEQTHSCWQLLRTQASSEGMQRSARCSAACASVV